MQQILEPTGNTEMLVIGNEGCNETNFCRSDGNERVLKNKAYMFQLDRQGRPIRIRQCSGQLGCVLYQLTNFTNGNVAHG